METKHTKGPWDIDYSNSGHTAKVHCHGYLFAEVYYNSGGEDEYGSREKEFYANAKLISAAPELLEALMIMCEDNGYDLDAPIEGFSHRTQQVLNAIKKATE